VQSSQTTPSVDQIIKQIPLLANLPVEQITIKPLGGQTNHNVAVITPKHHWVLRIPMSHTNIYIDRQQEHSNTKLAEQLNLAPASLWSDPDTGIRLTHYIEKSHPLRQDDFNQPGHYQALIQAMRQLQTSGVKFVGELNQKTIKAYLTRYYQACNPHQQTLLRQDYFKALDYLENNALFKRPLVPSHVDLTKDNIIVTADKIWLIDWEFSAMAPPYWDLAMLSCSLNLSKPQCERLLKDGISDWNHSDYPCFIAFTDITQTINRCWEGIFNGN